MAALNSSAFPPGSSRAFIESILQQQKQVSDSSQQGEENATGLTKLQESVNLLSQELDTVSQRATTAINTANTANNTANSALSAANSAGNGVGDINMTAVFKNQTATQNVAGPLGAAQFNVGGAKVVGGRQTGWANSTGTGQAGGVNADQAYSASGTYVQAELQAAVNGLVEVRKLAVQLQYALTAHGLIG